MSDYKMFPKEYLDRWDSYFYPNTDVFINKLGIKDYYELKEKETEISFEKLVELYENPIVGNFDKAHLCAIHKYIFGELYDWAGKYRIVGMTKQTPFVDPGQIDMYLDFELTKMNQESEHINSKEDLVILLTTYFIELMNIHPFREGNGRAGREFFREFVLEKSKKLSSGPLELDWTQIDGEVIND